MTDTTVHVFVGTFRDRDEACRYSQENWEPEPPAPATEQELLDWDQRNPVWPMRSDLGIAYLDPDCIETIDGADRYDYLNRMLKHRGAIDRIRQTAGSQANILVLIFKEALGGFDARCQSTPRLTYCGEFPCTI